MAPKRLGKELAKLPPGDRRRLSDFRNAWRKMTPEQRRVAIDWLLELNAPVAPEAE